MKKNEILELQPYEQIALRQVGHNPTSSVKLVWLGILANRQLSPIHLETAIHLDSNRYQVIYECSLRT